MTIIIKDYSWRQTQDLVIIRVPLKGVCLSNIDIFTSNNYLKIHSHPFLFEVCLWHPVVEAESSCTLADGEAVFSLLKGTAEIWPSLAADLSKQEALEIKTKAVGEAHAKAKKRREENLLKNDQQQKAAVREQICLNTQERELIEQTRQQVKTTALAQMGWTRTHSSNKIKEITDEPEVKVSNTNADKEIFKQPEKISITSSVPGPRQSGQISVSFTPRTFPTPCRESKLDEEQEWLKKQAEARRKTGFVAEDLRPEEKDPVWLCDKAKSFYDVGNYLGAVSAYSHALTLNSHLYELYAGRANAHLALGNLHKAITDSSQALELLTPAVPQNAEARARCLLCRGSALASLGMKGEALGELRAAEALRPDCLDIRAAIVKVQA